MTTPILQTNLKNLLHRGKVRDIYDLGDALLLVATDRISAFDVVLPDGIPEKGVVLTKLSAFWFQQAAKLLPSHYICLATDRGAAALMPYAQALAGLDAEVARRATVVRKAKPFPVECVVRGYITGSAWAEYRKSGTVSGAPMPKGLLESTRFPQPLFTPTTKAQVGHDQNISTRQVSDLIGQDAARHIEQLSLTLYNWAHDYALKRGIIIADTKFEFGMVDSKIVVIDEVLTPDSSRFWPKNQYKPGASQASFDKQIVRDWLTSSGWNKEPPAPHLPPDIIKRTADRYREVYGLLTDGAPL